MQADRENRNNTDVVLELIEPAGKRVLDVGCGDGWLTRVLTKAGARATGIDCTPAQLEKARATEPVGDESYVDGVGEDMSFADGCMDVVVFFNSLHHVPVAAQAAALAEAVRVLVPGGILYIAEPLAEGANFEIGKAIDDETEVRAHAYAAIKGAAALGFAGEREFTYIHTAHVPDFETYRDNRVRINADRRQKFDRMEAEIRANFERLGRPGPNGMELDQPMRVNVFRKQGGQARP